MDSSPQTTRPNILARDSTAGESDLFFAGGTPEIIDEYDAIDPINAQQNRGLNVEEIYLKERSMAGELGAKLMVVSTADGSVISETRLDAPAVFDGMSAANGKIFLSDVKGRVICLEPTTEKGFVTFDLPKDDTAPAATPRKQPSPMFRRMDVNTDKKVTREEFLGLWTDVFGRQDRDRDGMLNVTFPAPIV